MKHVGIAIGIAIGATFYSLIIWFIGGIISSLKKARRLEKLIKEVIINPCQMTAQKLYEDLSKLSALNRRLFKNGGKGAIGKRVWRDLYNNYILPNNTISIETKKGIRDALMGIGVYKLNAGNGNVYDGQQRGDLGEANVWHTLTTLTKRENCNVFHSVRVGTTDYNREIDNVIVSPKGIFLIEVKSVTHKPQNPYDGSDVVVFDDLNENPYQQIFEHQTAFTKAFGLNEDVIKNLLVMSYPHDEKKKIDISTFPTDTIYTTVKVDDLLEYYMGYNQEVVLDDATIAIISQKLTNCRNYKDGVLVTKYMFSEVDKLANAVSEVNTNSAEQQAKFCPQCGNKLTTKTPFCPNCGSKLN